MLNRFLLSLTFIFVVFFGWLQVSLQPVTHISVPNVNFQIESGSSLNLVINNLSEKKLIRSRTAFKLNILRLGLANKIQAGYFDLSANMSATTLAKALTKAYAKQVRVTVPEGLRAEEIVQIFSKAFQNIPNNNFNVAGFSGFALKNEGKLFPDTYDFAEGATPEEVLNRLVTRHEKVLLELKISNNKSVIIASLLEREAANDSEMPQIAGVIEKRLAAGWPLQIDATVQYALATKLCKKTNCEWWKPGLTLDDLAIVSPYNTYTNKGLPPAPISNPGKSALQAAANPVSSSAWFYLHDLNGKIHFADTIEEHNNNVCTYLKKDCN